MKIAFSSLSRPKSGLIMAAAVAVLLSSSPRSHALVIPYSENFDSYSTGDTVPTGFTEGGSLPASQITIQSLGGSNVYDFDLNGTGSLYSVAQFTNVVGTSFTLSTQFTLESLSTSGIQALNTGVLLLTDSTVSSSAGYRLLFSLNVGTGTPDYAVGKLTLGKGSTVASGSAVSTGTLTPTLNTLYTLTVTGTYASATNLTLNASLSDGTSTITSSYTDTAAQTGQYFGYRTASAGAGNTANTAFDNLSVVAAVPEPSSVGLTLLGIFGVLMAARKRRDRVRS